MDDYIVQMKIMKKIKVIVKEKTLLELAEDAQKGDLIDLNELTEVDYSFLEAVIDAGKNKVYASKLEVFKKTLDAENALKIKHLDSEIEALKKEKEHALAIKEKEVKEHFSNQLAELNNKIAELNSTKKFELDSLNYKKQVEIDKLRAQIDDEKKDKQNALSIKEQEVSKKFFAKIDELNKEIGILKATKASEIENIKSKNDISLEKIKNEDASKYAALEQKYNILISQHESQLKQFKVEKEAECSNMMHEMETAHKLEIKAKDADIENMKLRYTSEKDKALFDQKSKFEEVLKNKDDIINNLQRAKVSMNVKQIGEDLEAWCDNEVTSYMQNGLFNCTWTKDNKVVKEEGETKGSKADYIFKVFTDDKHQDVDLLTSICLDMKDENPDSSHKKTNADYYKQLNKNREKKNCKYSLLVSNLEMDKPNVLPIFKVREYENMYVVRPAYLMVFLNMIASLTTRFANLILFKEDEMIQFKEKNDLIEEFNNIKSTYLDKPLDALEKNIVSIVKSSESIKKACLNIDEQCENINNNYINQITEKISKYELKLDKKIIKKLED